MSGESEWWAQFNSFQAAARERFERAIATNLYSPAEAERILQHETEQFLLKHPRPVSIPAPKPHVPKPPPAKPIPGVHGTGKLDTNRMWLEGQRRTGQVEGETANTIRRIRRLRRGTEGAMNVGFLAGIGMTGGALLAARILIKMWIEDRILSFGENQLISLWMAYQQAITPTTVQDAEQRYQAYVRFKQSQYDPTVEPVLQNVTSGPRNVQVLSREDWLWQNFEVRWDVLSK